jgi:hypothetical protein
MLLFGETRPDLALTGVDLFEFVLEPIVRVNKKVKSIFEALTEVLADWRGLGLVLLCLLNALHVLGCLCWRALAVKS